MAEYLFGGELLTKEESEQIHNSFVGGGSSGGDAGYYSGPMGEPEGGGQESGGSGQFAVDSGQAVGGQEPGTDQQEEQSPAPSQLWIAQPENMIDVWNRYDQDPEYQDEHYTREQINQLHDYMAYRNQGKPVDQWGPLMNDDPFVTDVIKRDNWWEPQPEQGDSAAGTGPQADQSPTPYTPSDPALQGWNEEREKGDWNQLDWIGKLFTALSTNDPGINAPEWTKYSQAGQKATSSAMAGAVGLKVAGSVLGTLGGEGIAAALTNPYVLGGAALLTGGLVFYEAVSGKEIPGFNKFLELTDLPDTIMEHTVGFGAQAYNMARQNIERANADPNDAYGLMAAINDSLSDVIKNAGDMWRAGEFTYETYGSLGDFAIDILKQVFKGEEGTKPGEAWYFNRGINEKQQMAEGTYGDEAMRGIRQMYQEMDAMGLDRDTQTAIMNELVNRAGGTTAFVSDYTMQMLLDLDILATPLENEGAGLLAKVTGNELGVEAAKANRGSMLTQVPFLGSVYQALTKAKAPGGINEFFDNWKNLARSADVESLSAADRFFGGINADGTIKEFARTERTGLADLLPESKVAGVGNIANNVLNTYLSDVQDVEDLRGRLNSLAGESSGQSGMPDSADVRTVRDGMRHAIAATNPEIYIKQFEDSAGARATLAKTAEALGMEVKDVLSLYSETPAVFEQRVRQIAGQHNGMFADIDVSRGVEPISTIVKGFTTAKDGKGKPLAWDIRQLQYQITTSMIDSMAEYYTDYYGVKPNGTINLMFDTMKSAQSLLLLGWSPSYFINNVINNTVTSAAEGVLGFMTPTQIRQWMTAFGVTPARMDIDEGSGFRGQSSNGKGGLESFTSAVSAKKKEGSDSRLKGALSGLNGALRSANNKLGVFSSLSGKMETLQGNQLTTVSIQQYWGQRWKRGEGFHLMPDVLVQTIESQTPGMTNVIYSAIEAGVNMDQIRKVLFDTYVKPDAGSVMKQVCADLFRGEARVYEEVMEKSGVMNEINERFANCKTDEERAAVMADVQKKLDDYVDNLRREDLIQRANNVAATVEAEGLAPVAQMMSEMEMNHVDFWIRQRNDWTEAYQKMKAENMDGPQSQALLTDLVTRQQKEWADFYKQEVTTAAGIMKGLGFQHESFVKYIGYMNEKNKNWQDFNDAKSRELNRAYERTAALNAAGKKADTVQKQEVWDDFRRNVSELYDKHFEQEQDLQTKMDAAFIEGYEFATQKSGEQFRQNYQRIAEIRKQMHDLQQDAHEKTAKMNAEDKAKFYAEFNPRYNALIREIGNLGDANAKIIDEAGAAGPGIENHAPVTMTPEQTVQATEVMDTNNAVREKAMRERAGYLDRDGIKQGWIEAGRTPAEADLMMAVFDAAAEQWARDNGAYPDEFYSQAVMLKGIANWLPELEQGSLFQMSLDEFIEDNLDMMPDMNERFFNSIKKKGTVTVYANEPITDGVEVSISKQEIDSIYGKGEKIYTRNVPIDQISWGDSAYIGGTYMSPTAQQVGSQTIANKLSKMSVEQIMNSRYGDYIRKHFGNENFREWFGQSKVTDEYGLPLIVHHGTPNETFEIFDLNLAGSNTEAASAEMGIFFAGSSETGNYYAHGNPDNVMDVYLRIENPYIHDFKGEHYRDMSYAEIIAKAKAEGYDGVILKNTYDAGPLDIKDNIYVVFDPTQIKSIENDGTFNKLDPNILHQAAQEIVKGTFEHTDIGNIIRMLEASDVSTMVHESGHLFRRTLSQPLLTEFTTWAGFKDVGEFQELEARWQRNDPTLSEADRQRYVDAEEKFARGFEQYLMDGSAPTVGLKAVFKQFRDYLLDIYKKVKATVTGNDYSGQGEFVFHGATGDEVLNINAEINGVKLRDIFDRMLTDDVQRMPGFQELVTNLRTQMGQDRHNMRMSDKALTRRAQAEVTRTILQNFGSMEEAEAALQNYSVPMEIAGWRVDDATLYEAIQSAKADATMNPFAPAEWHEVKGTNTYAYSITQANSGKKYQLQYKVVELSDLVPSNLWFGDQLVINEDYPADAQARNRSADQSDVYAHAANLNAGLLIDEQHAIDSGTPIVGEGNMFVESGNGRVLSLQYAHDHFPEQWGNYQEYLRNAVGDYGIDPAQLDGFENPVLIRERLGGDSVSFAEDANSNRNKVMTASENALTDANKVNMGTLAALDIVPGEGVDTFTTDKNAAASVEWLRSLPESERARYSTTNRSGDLILSTDGRTRFINALFATLYATPESMDIIRSFSETSDSNIQALESGLKQSLPEMARAEGLIQSGSRAESLSITGDVMAAAGLLQEARKAGINIHDYLAQSTIPGMERWTPTQALLAGFFGDAKNNVKKIRDFFNAYGEEVYKAGDPNQLSLFGESKTREQMIDAAMGEALGNRQQAIGNGQEATDNGETPRLNQSVMDSEGKWTSQFAKTLDENLQRTFDDGMSMPLSQAESVYLRGELNTAYETRIQRLLRDFSNGRNLSADQYLYALEYMDWWCKGSEGAAPKGNPIWEAEIQKQVMNDFTYQYPDLVRELQRRYKKGAEVDPDTAVPNKGDYFKRTYEFEHGFWNIAGNVYRDGKLVAYLPEELDRMQRTIEVDGQSYQVLGVDMRNPEGLVYYDPILEIVRTCNVGKPEGFEEPRNPFMFIKPARQGSTPQTMPLADAYGELQQKYLNPALAAFGEAYKTADMNAKTAKMSGLDVGTRAQILAWLDQDVAEDMRNEKYRAIKYSDMKKDAAMLNYNQRYGFDPMLTMISPYQFWYTRSMWKWAKRMIDKPALGNAYERMKEYEDKNRQENLPSRLAGKFRIPLPFLPDWMGGGYYIDPYAQLFPFSQFGQSYSNDMNQATLNARTEEILSQMVLEGAITEAELVNAKQNRTGAVWENAMAEAQMEIGTKSGLGGLAGQFVSPPIFYDWWQKKQAGEDPGTLSSTRTGNAIRALTADIPLVSELGSFVGDAMTMPEKALRKLYGYDFNEFGQYGDQQIRKQISQMVADGEIDHIAGLNAMNEKSGTIWDMAADRQRKEAMLRVPGFAGAEGAKQFVQGNTDLGSALGGLAASLAGGVVYPEGEKTLREMKALRDQAYLDEANGVKGAVSDWYDKYGEIYALRTATYISDPEELLKFTLYQHISNIYYGEPYERQVDLANQLGPEFKAAMINKDTRNYKAVPVETLARWNAQLGGKNPNIGSIDVKGVEKVMRLSDQVVDAVQYYNDYKDQKYPGIDTIQNIYYSLPVDQRKGFLNAMPELSDYWEWNRQYKEAHQDVQKWLDNRSEGYNAETYWNSYAELSEYTRGELTNARATGKEISDTARYELQKTYNRYADPRYMSFEDYLKGMKNYK